MLMVCYSLYLIHNLVLLRYHLLDCYYIEKSDRMDYVNIRRQAASMRKGLFDQGYLDEQFYQLEDLQDDASPNFVEEVVTLFFRDSLRLMANIDQSLDKCAKDFNKLDVCMQQLKGSCTSIGASKMKTECTVFRDYCRDENIEGCMRSFQKLKREHSVLRQKLESYFQLLQQAGPI
ncbi:pseudo histidine-containing phosphotransfer protein 5-like [Carex rostrata]